MKTRTNVFRFLPLLHKIVEERAGERRFPSPCPSPEIRTNYRLFDTSNRSAGRGDQRGAFTLIEIMMVVAILGLTLSMGIPSFVRAIRREGMGKVERDMMQACQMARRTAILENKMTEMVIRPIDRTFSVPGAFESVQIPNNVDIYELGVNFEEKSQTEEARVRFNAKGTSDEFVIILHAADGSYRTIYLDCMTALPRVEGDKFNPYQK